MNINDAQQLTLLLERIQQLAEAIDAKGSPYPTAEPFTLDTEVGQRYIRLVTGTTERHSRAVHAFVDIANGDLLKSAGWKAPAKGARGNLLDDESFAAVLVKADRYGHYLYHTQGKS